MLETLNDCSIVNFSKKATTQKDIEKYVMWSYMAFSDNMEELVKTNEYDAINTTYNSTMGYPVVKFMPEA